IRNLAEEFGAPEFDPHVTIWAGPSDRNKVLAATSDIPAQWGSLDLRMRKLDQSDLYTKTFFIQFDHSDALHRISDHILSSVGASGNYILNPHLSLLYQELSEARRQELCRRTVVPAGAYHFDAVRLVEFEPPWSPRAIRESRVLAELQLGGKA